MIKNIRNHIINWFPVMNNTSGEEPDQGFSLLELLISFPLIAMLLLAAGILFCWGIKSYTYMMSDWELQNQVRVSLEQVVRDLTYAEKLDILGKKLYIFCRSTDETPKWVEYTITEAAMPKITRNQQPITGESTLGDIQIQRFSYRMEKESTVIIEIIGENLLTRHIYKLETAVTLPRNARKP